MPARRFVFIDFDDTISDPFLLHPQYVRQVGCLMEQRFGGPAEDWARAAIDTLEMLEREYIARFEGAPLAGYCDWLAAVRSPAATQMFERMGIAAPGDPGATALEIQSAALCRCDATYPAAGSALAGLRADGWELHLASAQESEYLRAAVTGAGLAVHFGTHFGPDLVDCAKEGREYYERIVAAVGCTPAEVVVVDDYPPAIGWALDAGAAVIQTTLSRERRYGPAPGAAAAVSDLALLPELLAELFGAPLTAAGN